MKRNLLAVLIVVILGGVTLWIVLRDSSTTLNKELKDFAIKDTASITKIFLVDKRLKQVTLTREAGNNWMVNGKFKARPDAIKTLLVTMHDLSVREPVSRKAKENIIKQLASGGTKVEAYAGDQLVKLYYVGGETMDMMGTYMLMADAETGKNSSEPFIMEIKGFNGYLTTRYFTSEDEWRDRTCFEYYVPNIRSIKIEHKTSPENSFIVTQSPGGKSFNLQTLQGQPLPFDTVAVKQFISYFNKINFENFETTLKPATKDSILKSAPVHVIEIMDESGKKNTVKMFLKKNDGRAPEDSTAEAPKPYDPDRMYALVNDGKDFVIVQFYVFGKLLQTPAYFIPRRNEEHQK
ncbi:MAG: hypothetical protein Fur0041_19920 [Bacteroidia bacterium]